MALTHVLASASPIAASEPAGGAALDQVAIATGMASVATAVLLAGIFGYRKGHRGGIAGRTLRRLAGFSERVSGLPSWAALPAGIAGGTLLVALLGMYWDISLHIDNGRDPGPLANPAHYLILFGLYGIFASGVLAMALPKERPGKAAIRIREDWYAPVGGLLIAACGGFALLGFPLDDMWHRLFGQDVTLWGPTHLMLFGGASMTLIGQAVLLQEGMRARRNAGVSTEGDVAWITKFRRLGLMGGLLIGLSTFQGEFDFGVPQFRFIFQPLLIAFAAGMALVCARLWIGRWGAIGAAVMFLVVRGIVALFVGVLWGETTPAMPLYLPEAIMIELLAVLLVRRPLAFGAIGGLTVGTLGFAAEWPWTHLVMPLPWPSTLMPEGLIVAAIAGVAGGILGALLGLGLRGELPSAPLARGLALGSLFALAVLVANGLVTKQPDPGTKATVALAQTQGGAQREATARVRIDPPSAADDAQWVTVTSWQGGGRLVVDRLKRLGPGQSQGTKPIPLYGDWKTTLRLHQDRVLAGVPIHMPSDAAIPKPEIPAPPRFTRAFVLDRELLQRERKESIPGGLWTGACIFILLCALVFLTLLALGVARLARSEPRTGRPSSPQRGGARAGAPVAGGVA